MLLKRRSAKPDADITSDSWLRYLAACDAPRHPMRPADVFFFEKWLRVLSASMAPDDVFEDEAPRLISHFIAARCPAQLALRVRDCIYNEWVSASFLFARECRLMADMIEDVSSRADARNALCSLIDAPEHPVVNQIIAESSENIDWLPESPFPSFKVYLRKTADIADSIDLASSDKNRGRSANECQYACHTLYSFVSSVFLPAFKGRSACVYGLGEVELRTGVLLSAIRNWCVNYTALRSINVICDRGTVVEHEADWFENGFPELLNDEGGHPDCLRFALSGFAIARMVAWARVMRNMPGGDLAAAVDTAPAGVA